MAKIVFFIQREEIDPLCSVLPKVIFPIEAASAAALLIKDGHQVKVIDLNFLNYKQKPDKIIIETLKDFNPDFVVSAPQMLTFLIKEKNQDTVVLFEIVKRYNKAIKTVYCGAFATSYPETALLASKADYLIRGEFDDVLWYLIDNTFVNKKTKLLPGIITKTDINDLSMSLAVDLDTLPFSAYKEFNYRQYFRFSGKGNIRYPEYSRKYTHYQSSRGCSCQCCFCNVSLLRGSRKYRVRPLEKVFDDLELLTNRYRIEEIHFLDENLTLDKSRTINLCKGIKKRGIKFKWIAAGGMSVYSLDEEILKSMWEAGCYRLNLAFESGSQEILDNIIRKPVKLARDTSILKVAKKIGFEIIGYFMIGFPSETKEQIKKTIDLAANPLFDYVTISIATPQEGTQLQQICIKDGLLDKEKPLFEISRRASAVYSIEGVSAYELEKIRWKDWDRINFTGLKKRKKIAKMMGISLSGIKKIRERTKQAFKKRWPHDYLFVDDPIGLAVLKMEDLGKNLSWIKQPDLRVLIERKDDKPSSQKQLFWFRSLKNSRNKIVLKIILFENSDEVFKKQIYIGNVTAFDIDPNNQEIELGIFIGQLEYRNKGYGTKALVLFIKYLRKTFGSEMKFRIKFLDNNLSAYRVYKKLGFTECVKKDYNFKCDDLVSRKYMVLLPEGKR